MGSVAQQMKIYLKLICLIHSGVISVDMTTALSLLYKDEN